MLRLLLLAYIAHTHKGFNYALGDTICNSYIDEICIRSTLNDINLISIWSTRSTPCITTLATFNISLSYTFIASYSYFKLELCSNLFKCLLISCIHCQEFLKMNLFDCIVEFFYIILYDPLILLQHWIIHCSLLCNIAIAITMHTIAYSYSYMHARLNCYY